MPKRRKTETISSILMGDTLGELAGKLDMGDGNERIIAILIGPGGVKIAMAEGITKPEAVGALNLAIDSCMRVDEWEA